MFTGSAKIAVTNSILVNSDAEAAIAARYQIGESLATIAQTLGLGRAVVRRVLKRLAVPPRLKCPVSGPHEQAILSLHAEGKTIKEISTSLGLNFATVYRLLLRNGRVKKRDR